MGSPLFDMNHTLLSVEQERALFDRYHAGRDSGDSFALADSQAAFDEIVTHNLRLVYSIVQYYYCDDPATDEEDFVQEGIVGLIRAVQKFDPARGVRFSTYAYGWIRQAATRLQQTANTVKRPHVNKSLDNHYKDINADPARRSVYAPVVELDAPITATDGLTLADMMPCESDVESEALNRVLFEALMNAPMSANYRSVLEDWLAGYTSREAGERQGLSRGVLYVVQKHVRSYYDQHLSTAGE